MTPQMNERVVLAARAAGIELKWMTVVHTGEKFISNWHPYTDDGDAIRLAAKLRMRIDFEDNEVTHPLEETRNFNGTGYRASIVRIAAEIGKKTAPQGSNK
jgi:hypothetical protein